MKKAARHNMDHIELIMDPINKRLDTHGADIRSINDKMDSKFGLVVAALDRLKDQISVNDKSTAERLTRIESERGIVAKLIMFVFGMSGGAVTNWIMKHLNG